MRPLDIPPGVFFEESLVRNTSNWREAHLIRWDGATILPVQGWEYSSAPPFASTCRAIHRWTTNDNLRCTAYLCEKHCYADTGGDPVDITPVGGFTSPGGNVAGYSDLDYSESTYGTPRAGPSKLGNFTPAYTLGNWGDELRCMTSADGRYLKWNPVTPATKLVVVPGSPLGRTFTVTQERHAMIFGIGAKFDTFGWSDQENDTDWNFASTVNKAGSYDLEPSSPIIARQQFFGGVVFFTMQAAYVARNIGLPYVYNYVEIGKPAPPINAQCVTEGPAGVMWPSVDGFWVYNGNSIQPIPCPIWDYIKRYIDFDSSRFYAAVVNNTSKNELWWLYVDRRDGSTTYNTRVIIYEYRHGWWSMGKLARSCGFVYSGERFPIMSDGLRIVKHEVGYNYPGESYPWAESFSMNLSEGQSMATVHQMLPEIAGDVNAVQFRLIGKRNRTTLVETAGPARRTFNGEGLVDFRETARDFRMRVEMIKNTAWTLGPILVDAKERGKK